MNDPNWLVGHKLREQYGVNYKIYAYAHDYFEVGFWLGRPIALADVEKLGANIKKINTRRTDTVIIFAKLYDSEPWPSVWQCANGHYYERLHAPRICPYGHHNRLCGTSLIQPVKDPVRLAAYKLGGMAAVEALK